MTDFWTNLVNCTLTCHASDDGDDGSDEGGGASLWCGTYRVPATLGIEKNDPVQLVCGGTLVLPGLGGIHAYPTSEDAENDTNGQPAVEIPGLLEDGVDSYPTGDYVPEEYPFAAPGTAVHVLRAYAYGIDSCAYAAASPEDALYEFTAGPVVVTEDSCTGRLRIPDEDVTELATYTGSFVLRNLTWSKYAPQKLGIVIENDELLSILPGSASTAENVDYLDLRGVLFVFDLQVGDDRLQTSFIYHTCY